MKLAAFATLIALAAVAPAHAAEAFPQEQAPLPVRPLDPQIGPRDAPLTLMVFGSYSDRFFQHFLREDMPAFEKRWGKKLRIVIAVKPDKSDPAWYSAAEAAQGVWEQLGEKGWKKFVGHLVAFEGKLDKNAVAGFATLAGIEDRQKFLDDLDQGRWRPTVMLGADGRKVSPKWMNGKFLNGRELGNGKLEALEWAFAQELAAVDKAKKSGVSARDIYGYRAQANAGQEAYPDVRTFKGNTLMKARDSNPEIGEHAIGTIELGMSVDAFEALGFTHDAYSETGWTCITRPRVRTDKCAYTVMLSDGAVNAIRYHLDVLGNGGFRYKGIQTDGNPTYLEAFVLMGCTDINDGIEARCGTNITIERHGTGDDEDFVVRVMRPVR